MMKYVDPLGGAESKIISVPLTTYPSVISPCPDPSLGCCITPLIDTLNISALTGVTAVLVPLVTSLNL